MLRATSRFLAAALVMIPLGPASAHEFWIAPERLAVAPGEPITADLKVGQMLRGEPYPYLSDRFTRFTVTTSGATVAVSGFEGDVPALNDAPARPGLNIVAHQTVPHRVTYDDWAIFRKYLSDEGLDRFAAVHRTRGLPETGFAERYTRYAKALVQAGPVQPGDGDVAVGMPFELVVSANPYAPGIGRLPIALFWMGEPVAGHQVTVFSDGDAVSWTTVTTDSTGRAEIPLSPGANYLLNAVRMDPVDGALVVWQSHWASITFGTEPKGS